MRYNENNTDKLYNPFFQTYYLFYFASVIKGLSKKRRCFKLTIT